jgi:hypothetical protein
MATSQNAQMSALELSALAGVTPEQLAIIARAMQTGALPLPPLGQSGNQTPASTNPNTTKPAIVNGAVAFEDVDREEGEVADEVESHENNRGHEFLHPPPTGPRNTSMTQRCKTARADAVIHTTHEYQKPVAVVHAQQKTVPSDHSSSHGAFGKHGTAVQSMTPIDRKQRYGQAHRQHASKNAQRQRIGEFLHAMFNAGFSHEQLASQVSNPDALRQVTAAFGFQHFASPPAQKSPSSVDSIGEVTNGHDKPLAMKPNSVKKAVQTKPTTIDRSAYLAKLQAAKNKKADAVSKSSVIKPPIPSSEATKAIQPAQSAKVGAPQRSTVAAANSPKSLPGAKAARDELLRQRLEAIRAAKATTRPSLRASLPQKIGPSTYSAAPNADEYARSIISAVSDIGKAAEYNLLAQEPLPDNIVVPAFGNLPAAKAPAKLNSPAFGTVVSKPTPSSTKPSRDSNPVYPVFSGLPGLFLTQAHQVQKSPQADAGNQHVPRNTSPAGNSIMIPAANHGQEPSVPVVAQVPKETLPNESPLTMPSQNGAHLANQSPTAPVAIPSVHFGSRNPVDEPMIIQVSDDEDDDDIMDISSSDREQDSGEQKGATYSIVTALPANPARPNLHRSNTSSSAVTSTPNTPKNDAYNKKLQELEELKRRLAEIELRKQAKNVSKPDGASVAIAPALDNTISSPDNANPALVSVSQQASETETTPLAEPEESIVQGSDPSPSPHVADDEDTNAREDSDDEDDDAMDTSDDATTVSSESVNDEYEPELESDSAAESMLDGLPQHSHGDVEVALENSNALSNENNVASPTSQIGNANAQPAAQQQDAQKQDVSLSFLKNGITS